MRIVLHIWRQPSAAGKGRMVRYEAPNVNAHMSFLEMLDVLNEELTTKGEEPIAFDHDCREGICGSCGSMVNGVAHGPEAGTTLCQLHMRKFKDGDEIYVEPWRARAFPLVKDLVVDRSALDRLDRRRRVHFGGHRQRTRRQRHSGREGSRRPVDGRGRLHRLWGVRGHVSERFGLALPGAPKSRTWVCCRKASPSAIRAWSPWWRKPRRRASALVRTWANAKPSAPRKSSWK